MYFRIKDFLNTRKHDKNIVAMGTRIGSKLYNLGAVMSTELIKTRFQKQEFGRSTDP